MNYSGKDNLEVMEGADNYNAYLLKMVCNIVTASDESILDFGAGTGFFAKKLRQFYPDKKIIAVEPADNLNVYYKGFQIDKVSSLETCPIVDVIYSFNVLEHIEDDVSVLKKMYESLRAGGRLCLYVPAFPCLYSAMDKKVGHYRRYTRQELIEKVTEAGFKIKQCQYKDFLGWFASIIYKIIGNKQGTLNPRGVYLYDKFIMPLSIVSDVLTGGKLLGKNLCLEAVK